MAPKRWLVFCAPWRRTAAGVMGAGSPPSALMRSRSAGVAENAVDLAVELVDHRPVACRPARRSRTRCRHRSPSGPPRRAWARREQRRALRAAHRQQLQLAGLDVRDRDAGVEQEVDLASRAGRSARARRRDRARARRTRRPALSSSRAARCGELPLPGEPKLRLPGLAFRSARNALAFLAGYFGLHHQEHQHARSRGYRRAGPSPDRTASSA